MKRILPYLFCLLLPATGAFAQTGDYYWSGKKKIFLTSDPNSVTVKFKNINASATATLTKLRQQSSRAEISSPSKNGRIKISGAGDLQKVKSLFRNDENVEYILQNYTLGKSQVEATNRICIQPKPEYSVQSIIQKYQGKLELVSSTVYNTHVLRSISAEETNKLANAIYESGMVLYSHPDFKLEIKTFQTDPAYSNQYYLNNTGQNGGFPNIDINAPEAWALSKGCHNTIKVGVIDDGVEAHEDLAAKLLGGFSSGTGVGTGPGTGAPFYSSDIHGTAVAGIIAAIHDNDKGIKGVAPSAMIIPVNNSRQDGLEDIAGSIDWTWNEGQADVINASWGVSGEADVIAFAIDRARTLGRGGKGTVFVAATGNYGDHVRFPANWPGVISVGACENTSSSFGGLWPYSCRGEQMDLVAPSGNVNGLGDIFTTDRAGTSGYDIGNYTSSFGGTSAAAPQVAGAAALMLGVNPLLTEAQVTAILQQTATDMGSTGFDHYFGYGRLNVQAAVQRVITDLGISAITAPAYVCSSSTISVPVNSQWPNVTWSVTPATVASITPSGNTATLTKIANGHATVTAVMSGTCGAITLTLPVEIGAVKPAGICGPGYNLCNIKGSGSSGVFRVCEPQPGVSYSWQIDGGAEPGGGSGSSITVRGYMYSVGYHDISVRANTPCGLSDWTTGTFRVISCGTGSRTANVQLSPNPAKSVLTVKLDTEKIAADAGAAKTPAGFTQIRIVDKLGNIHRSINYAKGTRSATINLSGIKPDLYTVLIYDGKEWITKQVVVK
jgi:serine protease